MALASNDGFNSRVLKELTGIVEDNQALFLEAGMTISAKRVSFDEATMWVELNDARTIGVPLAWFPRLLHASTEQLNSYELESPWYPLGRAGRTFLLRVLLEGRGDVTHRPHKVA